MKEGRKHLIFTSQKKYLDTGTQTYWTDCHHPLWKTQKLSQKNCKCNEQKCINFLLVNFYFTLFLLQNWHLPVSLIFFSIACFVDAVACLRHAAFTPPHTSTFATILFPTAAQKQSKKIKSATRHVNSSSIILSSVNCLRLCVNQCQVPSLHVYQESLAERRRQTQARRMFNLCR